MYNDYRITYSVDSFTYSTIVKAESVLDALEVYLEDNEDYLHNVITVTKV